jgi:hypothetical protein
MAPRSRSLGRQTRTAKLDQRRDRKRTIPTANAIRATGSHPYRGGDIDISLALYKVKRADYTRSLFTIVDSLTSSMGGPGEMIAALRFGGALLDSVQALLGLQDTEYLAGQRISVATTPLDPLKEQYLALVAPPTPSLEQLQVRNSRLESIDSVPYRGSDFVLWSITGQEQRGDESLLPFYQLKVEAISAVLDGADGIKRGKAGLLTAYRCVKARMLPLRRRANCLMAGCWNLKQRRSVSRRRGPCRWRNTRRTRSPMN